MPSQVVSKWTNSPGLLFLNVFRDISVIHHVHRRMLLTPLSSCDPAFPRCQHACTSPANDAISPLAAASTRCDISLNCTAIAAWLDSFRWQTNSSASLVAAAHSVPTPSTYACSPASSHSGDWPAVTGVRDGSARNTDLALGMGFGLVAAVLGGTVSALVDILDSEQFCKKN